MDAVTIVDKNIKDLIIKSSKKPHHIGGVDPSQGKSNTAPNWGKVDPLELAYIYIFESVELDHNTAQIQAKSVEVNAQKQNQMIVAEGGMAFYTFKHSQLFHQKWGRVEWTLMQKEHWHGRFSQMPRTYKWTAKQVSQSILEGLGMKNDEVSAVRGVIEDQINVLKQNASVEETNLNSTSSTSQQSISEGSSLMQMLTSLTSQISRI